MFPRAVCSRRFSIGCFALRSVHFVPSWSAKAPAPYSSRWRWFLLTPTRRGLQKHTHNPTSYRYKISQSACGVFLFSCSIARGRGGLSLRARVFRRTVVLRPPIGAQTLKPPCPRCFFSGVVSARTATNPKTGTRRAGYGSRFLLFALRSVHFVPVVERKKHFRVSFRAYIRGLNRCISCRSKSVNIWL